MKIISVNAWGGALFDELIDWVSATDADVLCFQEVTRTATARGWTQFTDGEHDLPQRANLFDDLAAALPTHAGHFAASDAGPVTTEDGATHVQQFGIATFVSHRLALAAVETGFLHGEYAVHDQWPTDDRPRVALATRVTEPGRRATTVVQLHGLRDPAGKGDTPHRLAQAHRLAELVTRWRSAGDVAVVAGDLNLLPDSATFAILAGIGLTDLVGDRDTRTPHYPKAVRHASYLLVSDPAAVEDFAILDVEVSDHRVLQVCLG